DPARRRGPAIAATPLGNAACGVAGLELGRSDPPGPRRHRRLFRGPGVSAHGPGLHAAGGGRTDGLRVVSVAGVGVAALGPGGSRWWGSAWAPRSAWSPAWPRSRWRPFSQVAFLCFPTAQARRHWW